jgi:RNA polymerase sigma-70 factor, ECF subfamily
LKNKVKWVKVETRVTKPIIWCIILHKMSDKAKQEKLFINNYQTYKDKIYTYFLYRVNFNRDVAEDLTSEVFIKTFQCLESYDESRPFQSWIYAISRNHLINYYRSCKREVGLEGAANMAVEFEQQIKASMELENVIRIIYELDSYCREVLLLKYVDGLDNKEIAQVLDKDEGAVRTQISRSVAELRSKLTESYE